MSAARSASMYVGACVCPPMMRGMAEASATRKPPTPRTRKWESRTAAGSDGSPMRQDEVSAFAECTDERMYSSICSSDCTAAPGKTSSPRYSSKAAAAQTCRPSRMPWRSDATSSAAPKWMPSMIGLANGSADRSRTRPSLRGRQATTCVEKPGRKRALLPSSISVFIPEADEARAGTKRIWTSGWSRSGEERTKPPWSHAAHASGPRPNRSQRSIASGLTSDAWPLRSASSVAATAFLLSYETTTAGWSCRPDPTPGRSARTGTPTSRRCSAGPIPERSSRCGVWTAPAQRTASPPRASRTEHGSRSSPRANSTPETCSRPAPSYALSRARRVACAPVTTTRFARSLAAAR
mmetsp:Transcript_21493/g.64483  ORF Transcript_21493/g.64483 Transcript_21493/m.64483 type:complete len:352 (-) Transcript_21493:704-1759(-)